MAARRALATFARHCVVGPCPAARDFPPCGRARARRRAPHPPRGSHRSPVGAADAGALVPRGRRCRAELVWSGSDRALGVTDKRAPAALSAALDGLARQRGTSRAELLRQAARELLDRESTANEAPILGVIGIGDGGPGAV